METFEEKNERVVEEIILEFGREDDRKAYEMIVASLDERMIREAMSAAKHWKAKNGKPPNEVRRYFMGVIKKIAQRHQITVFKAWQL